jgi:hypothetical protein
METSMIPINDLRRSIVRKYYFGILLWTISFGVTLYLWWRITDKEGILLIFSLISLNLTGRFVSRQAELRNRLDRLKEIRDQLHSIESSPLKDHTSEAILQDLLKELRELD